ncbi:hypothetical protein [Rhodovulum marinum]|uniref:Uncharacterized protein n=1 Tax=Rhodovulum marinum TaxID=320662 RepID=A0A4R2PZU0_9RHOB|nr:hypothetical protein [Rhodovulum marinum]TCP41822.1 hypothetical protein EV662_104166 [Rhodovulum marinum]
MPDRRLMAIVTGLMLIMGGLGGARAAEPTLEQLRTIDQLLTRNDTRALLSFLLDNPDLLSGDDELAVELRRFATEISGGRLRADYVPAPRYDGQPQVSSSAASAAAFPGIY